MELKTRPVNLEVKISPWKNQIKVEDAVPAKKISAMLYWLTFVFFRLKGLDLRPEAAGAAPLFCATSSALVS